MLNWLKKSVLHSQLVRAHKASPYADWPINKFTDEVTALKEGAPSEIDFDENFYMSVYKDVTDAVKWHLIFSGYIHYCLFGQYEDRLSSAQSLKRMTGITPSYPDDELFAPKHAAPTTAYETDLSHLPYNPGKSLIIIISNVHPKLFFAGYTAFFNDIATIFDQFSEITVLVCDLLVEPELVTRYSSKIKMLRSQDVELLKHKPDLVFCYDSETFFLARDVFKSPERTIYYCQDYEAGFFPYGSMFARAEKAVRDSRHLVLSTSLLKDFLSKRGLIKTNSCYITSPRIEPFSAKQGKSHKLFFYFRPELFNTRNLPEIIMRAVYDFTARHTGYEMYLVGTVDCNYSLKINGTDVFVISKLPKEQYIDLISSCDIVVSMIYSAHPGVIAYQAAASGIPTITNTFENRDADYLKRMSKNFIPYNPLEDDLCDCIEAALTYKKGTPDFVPELYSIPEPISFRDYIINILNTPADRA